MIAHGARSAVAQSRASFQTFTNYRADNIAWACYEVLVVVVGLAVWHAVARASEGSSLNGYDAGAFTAYFLIAALVRQFTLSGPVKAISARIRNGSIAMALVRPLHPLVMFTGHNVAVRGSLAMFVVPAVLVLLAVLDATITTTRLDLLVLAAIFPFACALRFITDAIAGSSGFWLVHNSGVLNLYRLIVTFASGMFAPLAVFPDWLESPLRWLPFYLALGYPVEVATGRAPLADAPVNLALAAGWLIALMLLLRVIWRRGVRAHEAVGL